MQKKNYIFNIKTSDQLKKIAKFYGMNETAVVSMLITERFIELEKEKIKDNKE